MAGRRGGGPGCCGVVRFFAFNTILHSVGGNATTVATDLAYPIGDALLLMLVVGGTAMIPGRKSPQWLLLAGAIACTAVGDTFNLFASSGSSSHLGTIFNGMAWPCAILLISIAVWVRPLHGSPLAPSRTAGFLLPGLGAFAGLSILVVDTLHQVTPVAIGLATATLITVGVRLALSVRSLRILTEKRHRQAITDELTGLGNRRQLFNLLDAFFADLADPETVDRRFSLLYVDLDHFKEINDSFGHGAGDEVLRQLGPRLTSRLRDSDVLVRVGGDELAVLVMDTDSDYAAAVAQRLIAELEQPFVLDTLSVRVGASIGIASAPVHASDSVALLRCADLAMYRAKVGPSPYEIYRHDVDDDGNRLRLVDELRDAIVGGHLEVHFQPQVDLITGKLSAMEALVRWSHPRLGLVPPLDFIPLAEEAGLMQSLTALVLERAVEQCAAWHAAGQTIDYLRQHFGDQSPRFRVQRVQSWLLSLATTWLQLPHPRDHRNHHHQGFRPLQARDRAIAQTWSGCLDRRLRCRCHLTCLSRQPRRQRIEARPQLPDTTRHRGHGTQSRFGSRDHRVGPQAKHARRGGGDRGS